jgi:hypothetical protein
MTTTTPSTITYRQSAIMTRIRTTGMLPLILGTVLTLMLVLDSILAPLLTTRDPLQTNTLLKINGEYIPAYSA